MVKLSRIIYVCSKCDAQFPRWLGQCPECGSWGTVEKQMASEHSQGTKIEAAAGKIVEFEKVQGNDIERLKTGIEEFDQVLGGGIVPGSLVLLGGEPGIGKSTLVLQITEKNSFPILYVSGEESAEQIKMRLDRLNLKVKELKFLGETNIEIICATLEQCKPQIAIIDSIQTMFFSGLPSEAGSVNQVRACTVKLLGVAKKNKISIFIVGHVTKEGFVAGPKTLEHLVDCVIYLEGERYHQLRLLRTIKNRFGSTNEVGVFEMKEDGLKEIKNPSHVFLQQREGNAPGSVVTAVMQGNRPFLIEVQALVSKTAYGYPQRRSAGFDFNRLQLLIAVLTKICGLNLSNLDVLINIVGGIKIEEPACDLAVCLAIASAYKNQVIDSGLVAFGEVGLDGGVRNVSQTERRLKEISKLGFKKAIIPKNGVKNKQGLEIIEIKNLKECLKLFF
ncbi:MAG: DNA repair protein RadA/Sm [Parcubacteria group bacterium Athens0714_12]|nr:MAG: DNA repair protein RadA/Sm [Parcubacteria group bacterium Athens0714_12]